MTDGSRLSAADLRRARHDAAVEAVATGLVGVERGQLRLPRCVSEIAVAVDVVDRLLRGGLVVVLTAGQELVDRVAARWTRAHPDAAYLLTGRRRGSGGLPPAALYTTGPDVISAWAAAETAGLRVLVSQHRHADLVGEGLLKAGGWADLVIVHEAQHTAGCGKRGAAVHDDRVLPAAARLYTTAAPRFFRRPPVAPACPDEVALSMDEEHVFGPVLHEYSAEQALADGVAAGFRLRFTPSATGSVVGRGFCAHRGSRRTIKVTLAEALVPDDTPPLGDDPSCCADDIAITVNHPGAADPDTTVTVTSASGATGHDWVRALRTHAGLGHVLRALREWDPAFAHALDAARAHGPVRHPELLRWIDIEPSAAAPRVDVVAAVVAAGTDDWWAGYGHLAAHHARTGDVVVPTRHNADGYPLGTWLLTTRTTHLHEGLPLDRHDALQALGATAANQHDVNRQRRWDQHIATARAFHARYGHLDVDLPGTEAPKSFRAWVSDVRRGGWPVTDAERATLDALGMPWDPPLLLRRKAVAAAFADHHARHGNLDIPDDLVVEVRGERTRLVNWVSVFRDEHRLDTLHPEVRHLLQEAGFVFDPDEARWQDVISAARRHHELHGDLDIAPGAVRTAAGECLLTVLRHCRSRWRRRSFDAGRAATLTALDPLWGTVRRLSTPPGSQRSAVPRPRPVSTAGAAWQAGLEAAWRHRNRFGHLLPATGYRDPVTGLCLQRWLSTQRRHGLTPEQTAALDALDMIWDPAATNRMIGIENARSYHEEHGHLRVPAAAPYHGHDARGEPYNLRNALVRARRDQARGVLHPEWRQALDDLGDDLGRGTETRFTDWDDVFAVVKQFHDEHGHLDVPADLRAEGTLVRPWLNNQRPRLKAGWTTEEQKEKLDSVGFLWDAEEAGWMEKYRIARRFHREHGHLAVTKTHVRGNREWAPLPNWLRTQVKLRTAQRLSDERVTLLELLDMPWVERPGREHQWDQRLRQVADFLRAHGHVRIHAQLDRTTDPAERAELKKLAAWLNDQLVYARRATLRTDRRAKLTAIGIDVPKAKE